MISLTANGNIFKGFCVSISLTVDDRVELTDWNNYQSVAAVVGIATNDAFDGMPVVVQNDGVYENTTWNFIRCKPVYAYSSGLVTQNIPEKNILQVGKAISATKILIKISDFMMINV